MPYPWPIALWPHGYPTRASPAMAWGQGVEGGHKRVSLGVRERLHTIIRPWYYREAWLWYVCMCTCSYSLSSIVHVCADAYMRYMLACVCGCVKCTWISYVHMKVPQYIIVALALPQFIFQISRKINFSIWGQICLTLGYFPNTRVVGIEIRAFLKITFSLGKCWNGIALHHLTFFLTVKCCLSLASCNRRAELDNMGL